MLRKPSVFYSRRYSYHYRPDSNGLLRVSTCYVSLLALAYACPGLNLDTRSTPRFRRLGCVLHMSNLRLPIRTACMQVAFRQHWIPFKDATIQDCAILPISRTDTAI